MRALWLTRKYPTPPNSGDLIYSAGLIASFAQAGARVTVIAHDNDQVPIGCGANSVEHIDEQGVTWLLGSPQLSGRLLSLLTSLPSDSYRLKQGGPAIQLTKVLTSNDSPGAFPFEAVIFDHGVMGWALPVLLTHLRENREAPRPLIVYLSHNHEARIRREFAANSGAFWLKSMALRWDAHKYANQEIALCQSADLICAITDEDKAVYQRQYPSAHTLTLTPGYTNPDRSDRAITTTTTRRVILVGSFEWIVKRANLESFLNVAAQSFASAGIDLQIVGKTDESFKQLIKRRFPSVAFIGQVDDISTYLLDARIGLVIETFGGGFKLKSLDYVFHGVPIVALRGATAGLPLESPDDILHCDTTVDLVKRIHDLIDDIDRLNLMRVNAARRCSTAFRWQDRGHLLLETMQHTRAT